MNVRDMEYVCAIAREKSFSQAARKLFVSQPALSQYIARLEKNLGVKLFYRARTSVQLTHAGELLATKGEPIMQEIAMLERELRNFSSARQHEISVGVSQFYGQHVLASLLVGMKQRLPDYQINIVEGESHFLEKLLVRGELDLGIFPAPVYDKSITFTPVYCEKILFALNKDNAQACETLKNFFDGRYVRLEGFRDFPFILLRKGLKLHDVALKICAEAGFQPQSAYQTENLDTVYSLVENNYGVAFLPSTILQEERTKIKRVAFYEINSPNALRDLGLAYLSGAHDENFVRKVLVAARSVSQKW